MPPVPDDTRFEASADASSHQPQDWGRALKVVLQDLAEQAERGGYGPASEALLGTEVRLRIEPTEDGVRITGAWQPEVTGPDA